MINYRFIEVKKTAKAIYVVSGLEDMVTYLNAVEENGEITEEENDRIIDLVTAEYANVTIEKLSKIRMMF